jgi:mannose-6-phosphate isomerase-like protein (cupin superfamily)
MSDYTIKNLKTDVEDSAAKFGLAPDVEARFARQALECKKLGLSYQHLAPNARSSFGHKHAEQEEVYVVVQGGGRVKLDDELRELGPWDAVRVGPDTVRAFEAGPEGLTAIVFGAPIEAGVNDAELIPNWWDD